jgi:hypothetical protein
MTKLTKRQREVLEFLAYPPQPITTTEEARLLRSRGRITILEREAWRPLMKAGLIESSLSGCYVINSAGRKALEEAQ